MESLYYIYEHVDSSPIELSLHMYMLADFLSALPVDQGLLLSYRHTWVGKTEIVKS
jgi:hypothetical protein